MSPLLRRAAHGPGKVARSSLAWGLLALPIALGAALGHGVPNATPTPTTARVLTEADRARIEGYGAAFVAALTSGSEASRATSIGQIYSRASLDDPGRASLVDQMARLHNDLGPLQHHHSELIETRMGTKVSYVLHVYARAPGATSWKDFQFRLDPEPPNKLDRLVFIADVAEPVYLPNGDITDAATLAWLNNYVDKLVAENDLAGSVLLAKGDTPFFERLYGHADAARRVEVSPKTRFNLGSGNKMFTAIAAAQLVETGKLRYADAIAGFFPDFPDSAFARKATLHHLLSHTSGVGEYWTDEYRRQWRTITELKHMLPWVYRAGTSFVPGTRYGYSNSNFVLAGLIVEKASGSDYFEYVRARITGPLGMRDTESYRADGRTPDLAEPLRRSRHGWEVADHPPRGSSAGGGFSTARDMLRFARGLAAGKLVERGTLELVTTPHNRDVKDPADEDYGYGFILANLGNVRSWGHGGTATGINFELRYFPREDLTFVIFCNQDNGAYDDLRKNIVKLITGAR